MKKESFDEKVGWGRMLLVGFQHVLTMCPGTIAVPLILAGALGLNEKETAFLVSANFFTSGIAILIQVLGIGKLAGSRYPIVLGSSFAPLSPMILIGKEYGMAALFGSVIASGAVIFLLSFFMDKIFEITAKEVTIQVKDERTGVVYSRTLPIDYYENANVLKLSGENLDGSSSSIVFYSARGIERLKDLTGRGADHDPCGTHKPEDQ